MARFTISGQTFVLEARRLLKRLGLRRGTRRSSTQAEALRPYIGQWVALAGPTEVLVAADSPQEILAWLSRHERSASYGMFRVPANVAEAEGAAPT